jgi:hypothetical protein
MAAPGPRPSYPRSAYLLSLIGGILIFVDALLVILYATYGNSVFSLGLGALGMIVLYTEGIIGALCGIVVVVGAVRFRYRPATSPIWGLIVIVVSIVSVIVVYGGFFVGFVLALIGGVLAYTWKPQPVAPVVPAASNPAWRAPAGAPSRSLPPPTTPGPTLTGARFCQFCGTPVATGGKYCPRCGASVQGA